MIAEDLRRFLQTRVPSVPFLESALLFRASAGAELRDADLARHLYETPDSARDLIAQLLGAHVIVPGRHGGFLYSPHPADFERLLDRVAQCYGTDLLEITQVIHAAHGRRDTEEEKRRARH